MRPGSEISLLWRHNLIIWLQHCRHFSGISSALWHTGTKSPKVPICRYRKKLNLPFSVFWLKMIENSFFFLLILIRSQCYHWSLLGNSTDHSAASLTFYFLSFNYHFLSLKLTHQHWHTCVMHWWCVTIDHFWQWQKKGISKNRKAFC